MLGNMVDERTRSDPHYQPPFHDYRDDLRLVLTLGIEEGCFLQKVADSVKGMPGITWDALCERFTVFKDKKSKLSADKKKPEELRSDYWLSEQQFKSMLYLVSSIERVTNKKFYLILSGQSGLAQPLQLRIFEKPNLRSD